jgi:hypothetical protein
MMPTRRQRGSQTQTAVAGYLQEHGWPYAEPVGAGRQGPDVTGTPGLSIEVKARRNLDLPGWLRQTRAGAEDQAIPVLIHRPDGSGPATIADWPVTMHLADLIGLLHLAGFGTWNGS